MLMRDGLYLSGKAAPVFADKRFKAFNIFLVANIV